ncbi:hypothetical protein BaRGS_00022254 [Batillaria attramentaria]|uniref:Uncharacterized protein n=1 Tax=Batillaria attramentaria TaxID=370345 RepID=A0ABD0KHC6_9CAEN
MASGAVADNFSCSLCLEQFKNPKFLDCHHSFCEGCLVSLARNSAGPSQVACPECRKVTQLPRGGVSQLQTNFYITRLLDANADREPRLLEADRDPEMCQAHRNKKLCYYCVNCDTPICPYCRMTKHKKHHAIDLDSAVAAAIGEIEKGKSRLERRSWSLAGYLTSLGKMENAIEETRLSVERTILERAETINRWVAEAVDRGLESLQNATEEVREPIRQYKAKASSSLNTIQAIKTDLERVLSDSSGSSQEVISLRRNMAKGQGSEDRLSELMFDFIIPCKYPRVQFNDECLQPEAIAEFIGTGRVAADMGFGHQFIDK